MTGSLEFRIPISANPQMYAMVRLAALSLARLGPPYCDARILVSVGDSAHYEQIVVQTPWARDFPIEWRVAAHAACEANPHAASGNDRYADSPRADTIILCDADLCVVDRFDALLDAMAAQGPAVAGLQAHFAPFHDRTPAGSDRAWTQLLTMAGIADTPRPYGYSLVPDGSQGCAPAYFNYGFVAFNRAGFHRIAPIASKYTELASRYLAEAGEPTVFQSQVGLSLAIAMADLAVIPLGHADHCANDDRVFDNGLDAIAAIKAIHYLRTEEFDRATFLTDRDAYEKFLSGPLESRVSERLRHHILTLSAPFLEAC